MIMAIGREAQTFKVLPQTTTYSMDKLEDIPDVTRVRARLAQYRLTVCLTTSVS